jgi:hypothetical protein
VKDSADIAVVRPAVPQAVRTDGSSECFVVAYPNGDCRYDRIAALRIVEFGFDSRQAAVARTKTLSLEDHRA